MSINVALTLSIQTLTLSYQNINLVISIKDTTKGSTQAPLLYQRPSTFHRRKQSEQRSDL